MRLAVVLGTHIDEAQSVFNAAAGATAAVAGGLVSRFAWRRARREKPDDQKANRWAEEKLREVRERAHQKLTFFEEEELRANYVQAWYAKHASDKTRWDQVALIAGALGGLGGLDVLYQTGEGVLRALGVLP